MSKYIYSILLLINIVILAVTFSCGNNSSDSSEFITIWFEDTHEYRTNNPEVAQNETPFTIVLPTYLPEDLTIHPFFEGHSKSAFRDDIPVRIMYYRHSEDFSYIYIREYNQVFEILPSDEGNYILFSEVKVLEQDIEIFVFSGDSNNIPGFLYTWNRSDVHFEVEIYDYQRDIAREIIESMIK